MKRLTLTARELEVERLRQIDGLTYRAIGARFGFSPARAREILEHAQAKRLWSGQFSTPHDQGGYVYE